MPVTAMMSMVDETPAERVLKRCSLYFTPPTNIDRPINSRMFAMIEPIKEYQLKNHLPGDTSKNQNIPIIANSDVLLASEDFQLYQALKVLRTMYMLNDKTIAKKQ